MGKGDEATWFDPEKGKRVPVVVTDELEHRNALAEIQMVTKGGNPKGKPFVVAVVDLYEFTEEGDG